MANFKQDQILSSKPCQPAAHFMPKLAHLTHDDITMKLGNGIENLLF